MNKFFFSILAVGAMVACTKSEVKYDDNASEISFAPVATTATKAAIDGNAYPTAIPFNVFSYYAVNVEPGQVTNSWDSFTTLYLNNKKFAHNPAVNLFTGAEHSYYWPKTGSLVFAGYSPCVDMIESTSQSYTFADKLSIVGYVQSENTAVTDDLMWFDETDYSFRENVVPVTFKHACSWLSFYVHSNTPDANFRIKKLVLNNVQVKGDFYTKVNPTWDLRYEEKKNVVVMDADVEVPSDATQLQIDDNGVIVLPQPCVSATITYTMDNGAGVVIEQTQTFDLSAGINGTNWLYSKHYIYTIQFSAAEIMISPSVTDWDDVNGDMVVVD